MSNFIEVVIFKLLGSCMSTVNKNKIFIGSKEFSSLSRNEKILALASCFNPKGKLTIKTYEETGETKDTKLKFLSEKELIYGKNEYSDTLHDLISEIIKEDTSNVTDQKILLEKTNDILSSIFHKVPDEDYSVPKKFEFIEKYFVGVNLTDLSYREYLKPLKGKLSHKGSELTTKISLKEYHSATQEGSNYSDYIILSLGLLNNFSESNTKIKTAIKKCEKLYFELDYESAIKTLIEIASDLKKEEKNTTLISACQAIIQAKDKTREPTFNDNHTRHFFETKLGQYLLGQFSGKHLSNVDQISKSFIKKSVGNSEDIPEAMSEISEVDTQTYWDRYDELTANSDYFSIRDRYYRSGIESKRDEAKTGELGETVWSRNLGLMKSTSPSFRDDITERNIRNRTPDINEPGNRSVSYPKRRDRLWASFAASLSGHTFYFIPILEHVIDTLESAQSSKEDTQAFIQDLVLAYLATYLARGFHSTHEILDVFRESHVKKILTDKGIDVESIFASDFLNTAILNAKNDTLQYSKMLALKKSTHTDLSMSLQTTIEKKIKTLLENAEKEKKMIKDGATPKSAIQLYIYLDKNETDPSHLAISNMIIKNQIQLLKNYPNLIKDVTAYVEREKSERSKPLKLHGFESKKDLDTKINQETKEEQSSKSTPPQKPHQT